MLRSGRTSRPLAHRPDQQAARGRGHRAAEQHHGQQVQGALQVAERLYLEVVGVDRRQRHPDHHGRLALGDDSLPGRDALAHHLDERRRASWRAWRYRVDSPSDTEAEYHSPCRYGQGDCALRIDEGRQRLAEVGARVRQVPFQDSGVGVCLVDGGRLALVEQVVVDQPDVVSDSAPDRTAAPAANAAVTRGLNPKRRRAMPISGAGRPLDSRRRSWWGTARGLPGASGISVVSTSPVGAPEPRSWRLQLVAQAPHRQQQFGLGRVRLDLRTSTARCAHLPAWYPRSSHNPTPGSATGAGS